MLLSWKAANWLHIRQPSSSFNTAVQIGDKRGSVTRKLLNIALVLSVCWSPQLFAAPFVFKASTQGITFRAESPNEGSINRVTLEVKGSKGMLASFELEAVGTIAGAEVADLDANGYPEIYIYVSSAGSGSYGSLIAYASNRNLSFSEIYLPPLSDEPELAEGYLGHDEFAVGEGALLRRFPVYREGDSNASPSGGMRQIQYELVAGEAGWVLSHYRVVEY